MAGLIAGADIMFGGRTPHPYHTRPGMVSRSNDGDPHGKAPSGVPGNDPKRPGRTGQFRGTPLVRIGRGEYVLASATVPGGDSTGPGLLLPAAGRGRAASLSEDEVKQGAKEYLEAAGFHVTVAWGRQQVNYFLGALGELLQRMSDPEATYGLALPDSQQYRGLAARLPALAWQRLRLTVLFVSKDDAGQYTVQRITMPS
jgi:hypothetical protein